MYLVGMFTQIFSIFTVLDVYKYLHLNIEFFVVQYCKLFL